MYQMPNLKFVYDSFASVPIAFTKLYLIKKGRRVLLDWAVQLQLDCIPVLGFFTKWVLSKIIDGLNAPTSS